METFSFPALGTTWSIVLDHDYFSEIHRKALLETVVCFEEHFSRFLPESEVNQFRDRPAGVYEISPELALILAQADRLRRLTAGRYDPAIGGLLEASGYNPTYRFTAEKNAHEFRLPDWSLDGTLLTLSAPVIFDLGGIGKGYAIDLVATALKEQGYVYFLVEGGGDMYCTTKRDGSPYQIALE